MKNKKLIIFIFIIIVIISSLIILRNQFLQKADRQTQQTQETQVTKYWTCGMHPSVHVSDAEYKRGKINCPICNMPLIPGEEGKAEDKEQRAEKEEVYYGCGVKEEGHCPHCDKGIADAKCICAGHSFVIKEKGLAHCPVCQKPLKEINPADVAAQAQAVSRVKLSERQIELAGVKTEPLTRQRLSKTLRTVGSVAYDPGLTVTQEEFLTALETRQKVSESPDLDVIKRADDIVEKSKIKLRLLGLSDEQITQLEKEQSADKSLILPQAKMWVYADIYEYDLGWIKIGQQAKVTTPAYPGEKFTGKIISINPVLDPNTRSVKVRIEVDNPDLKLKPQMYMDVIIEAVYLAQDGSNEILAVPKDAVLDTGARKIVYVDAGDGIFLGKEITTGPQATALVGNQQAIFYPVLNGLSGDETVVTKGNFLIDSQSQLTGGMSVLWGGATEIKEESAPSGEPAPIQTEHKH